MNSVHQEITQQLIKRIEAGNTKPWSCPWIKTQEPVFPVNAASGRPYQGVNVFLLWGAAIERGFSYNRWVTYRQAQELGGQVRKGERGFKCLYFNRYEVDSTEKPDEKQVRFVAKRFVLFNLDQVDGIQIDHLPAIINDDGRQASVEAVAKPYLKAEGIRVVTGGNRAYYSPSQDYIRMPTGFHNSAQFAGTLAHELAHSSGHPRRLNRFAEQNKDFNSHHEAYAAEELVAELSACFWCAKCGITDTREDHVSYLAHWLQALKNDAKFFFKAAKAADQALQYIEAQAMAIA